MSMHAEDYKAMWFTFANWVKDHPWQTGVAVALVAGLVVGKLML